MCQTHWDKRCKLLRNLPEAIQMEAEILLTENLGSYDPKHEFIEKFFNYKDFLPANVLEIALQGQNDQMVTGYGHGDVSSTVSGFGNSDQGKATVPNGTTKGGGKKKGRKGKKVVHKRAKDRRKVFS